jgi:hypothetical protein
VKPAFSEDEKIYTVRTLLAAIKENHAKIIDYSSLTKFLNDDRIKILCGLKKSGTTRIYKNSYDYKDVECYNNYDAEKYFEWLKAVISGTETEGVNENIIKQANNQLFRFIDILGENLQKDENVQLIEPYDWQSLFTSFDERLIDIQNIIDKGNRDITEVLKGIKLFLTQNKTLLKQIKDESEAFAKKEK